MRCGPAAVAVSAPRRPRWWFVPKKGSSTFCGPAVGCRGRFANRSGQYLTACRDRSHAHQAPTSMLLPMVSRPFAFLERRGQRAQLEIARAFQSAPGSSEISTCTLMRSASRPGEFVSSTLPAAVDMVSPKITRFRTSGGGSKFSMPFALMAGQVGTLCRPHGNRNAGA